MAISNTNTINLINYFGSYIYNYITFNFIDNVILILITIAGC